MNLLRIRCTPYFENWVTRCEETINSYLSLTKLDFFTIDQLLSGSNRIYNTQQTELGKTPIANGIESELRQRAQKKKNIKNEEKMNMIVMGKLNEDLKFLDHLASHPALKENIFSQDIHNYSKILNTIQGSPKTIKGSFHITTYEYLVKGDFANFYFFKSKIGSISAK